MRLTSSGRKIAVMLVIVALALVVRGLTANFIRAHLDDPGWFQFGSFAIFDRQAKAFLEGQPSPLWIPDSTRTDLIQYPPGSTLWIAAVYVVTGERSAASVQRVQWVIDSFAVLLIVAIGVTAYGWSVGLTAGFFAALSPLLALCAATPGVDVPTTWVMLAAVWLSVLAYKHKSLGYAITAGVLLGLSCWIRVNPLLLFVVWGVALYVLAIATKKKRLQLAVGMTAATLILIAPMVTRNLIVFYPEVVPTGLNIGWTLLAGIGETERGREFGVPAFDAEVIEQDRRTMGFPPDAPLGLVYPDGVRRDRERGQRALAIIKEHPVWYLGVAMRRGLAHLKLAGKPVPYMGSTGVNVTSKKCLPVNQQVVPISTAVNSLGMIQSVLRYAALPLMLWGIWIGMRRESRMTLFVLSTVIYYLFTLAFTHSELRYGLPMQAVLVVFQARGISDVAARVKKRWKN